MCHCLLGVDNKIANELFMHIVIVQSVFLIVGLFNYWKVEHFLHLNDNS